MRAGLLTARLRDERGFTLVEVMIALVIGLVVSTALLAIVIVSVHLSSNYTDRVDANQQGRLAMEKITQALNSSCVTPDQAPVLAGSTSTTLMFYSTPFDLPGTAPEEITISGPTQWGQAAPLTMVTQILTGTPPNWMPSNLPPTSIPLAPWAGLSGTLANPTPVFAYFGYASNGTISTTPFPLTNGQQLGATDAAATAEVAINYQALPSDDWNANSRPVDFSDEVTFRLTPPSSSANAANLPCQ